MRILLLTIMLFCFNSFAAINEVIQPKTLNWNDSTALDFAFFTVFCEPQGNELNLTSPNVTNITQSELSLNDSSIRDSLGMNTEGETYQLCVTVSDNNANSSTCSAVVQYFFDMTAPPVVDGAIIQDR